MCISCIKQTSQPRLKAIAVLISVGLVVEYNYSIFWATLSRKETNGVVIADVGLDDRNKTGQVNDSDFTYIPPVGYLVWTEHCRMQDVNPFTEEAMDLFEKKTYQLCSKQLPLTKPFFDINTRTYSLHINEFAKQKLIGENDNVSCCYQSVLRSGSGDDVDNEFELEPCVPFYDNYVVPPNVDAVIVSCKSIKLKKEVQKDAFHLVREKPEVRQRQASFANDTNQERPVSVLMISIDSMSRFNLRRTMPKTTEQLVHGGWFELSGYNKVGDNTFPNLIAILSGYNMTTAFAQCGLPTTGGIDNCNLIWTLFRQYGYVTAYAEDETWISTFNYAIKGFNNSPVDYYHRPFMMAVEKELRTTKQSGMTLCAGLRHSAEYVYDFALSFATRYKSEPYFGLFWTNSFSHNAFDDASGMDVRIARYIRELKERGILEDSIVFFFSDHGIRFGELRRLKQGFVEERLPFFFIWLPIWFQAKHPSFAHALKVNRHRLTNNFDFHMTLKHILQLSGRAGKLPQAYDCANCQTLFSPVPRNRSCRDIGIDDNWCTCVPYESVKTEETEIVEAVNFALDYLNSYLESGGFSPPCVPLLLTEINDGQIKLKLETENESEDDPETDIYRVLFTANDSIKAKFEASLTYSKKTKTFRLIGTISRLDFYGATSRCISDTTAKKYCICNDQ